MRKRQIDTDRREMESKGLTRGMLLVCAGVLLFDSKRDGRIRRLAGHRRGGANVLYV